MSNQPFYYHLSGAMLSIGSVIVPGNWGRVVRAWGWQHTQAIREMAIESARIQRFPQKPSRLEAAFIFLNQADAQKFKANIQGFQQHILYRVSLTDPARPSHVTDHRLCAPQGTIRPNWADVYWLEPSAQAAAIPGIDWNVLIQNAPLYEMLTLSPLKVEERL